MIRMVNLTHDIYQKLKEPAAILKRLSVNLSQCRKHKRRCVNNYTRIVDNFIYKAEETSREVITEISTVVGRGMGNPKPTGRYLSKMSCIEVDRVKIGWKYFTQGPYMIQQGGKMNMSKNEQTWATSE